MPYTIQQDRLELGGASLARVRSRAWTGWYALRHFAVHQALATRGKIAQH
jgi:hypothetical protein